MFFLKSIISIPLAKLINVQRLLHIKQKRENLALELSGQTVATGRQVSGVFSSAPPGAYLHFCIAQKVQHLTDRRAFHRIWEAHTLTALRDEEKRALN